jgi:hypothetical protein
MTSHNPSRRTIPVARHASWEDDLDQPQRRAEPGTGFLAFGIILLVLGASLILIGLVMDTSVSTLTGSVQNLGLLFRSLAVTVIGTGLFLTGALFLVGAAVLGRQ